MSDSIFSKIISGELPSSKVYEDDDFYAFLDIMPVSRGHVLVVPKKYFAYLGDMPEDLLQKYMPTIRKVAEGVKKGLGADGYNIQQNNGAVAGQTVFHVHFHIIPRYENDGLKLWPPNNDYSDDEKQQLIQKISSAIS